MQLFALDANHRLIRSTHAVKQKNYLCLECCAIVRVRAGFHRRPHFYHLEPAFGCRQHQKGEVHLQLQTFLFNLLPAGDCMLEYRFPEIQRIADVAWLSQKIIFEIQCSPIKSEEVSARNQDYHQAGWTVVWILHDRRFNQWRLSAAEMELRNSSHYFTNMSREGNGIIYDQFDIHEGIFRKDRMNPLPVDLSQPYLRMKNVDNFPLNLLKERESTWIISFKGDLKYSHLEKENLDYIQEASIKEKRYISTAQKRAWFYYFEHILKALFITPWKIIFRIILEKSCR